MLRRCGILPRRLRFPLEQGIHHVHRKVLYRASATATGGREGRGVSDDGALDVKLTTPRELGGAGNAGTNPEQLFAVGYSACFLGAMKFVGGRDKIAIPSDVSVNGVVGIGAIPTGFGIEVELKISLPGMDRAQAENWWPPPTSSARTRTPRAATST